LALSGVYVIVATSRSTLLVVRNWMRLAETTHWRLTAFSSLKAKRAMRCTRSIS
jgi:hypothetical protein